MVQPVDSDRATWAEQHTGTPRDDIRGERCLRYGLCHSRSVQAILGGLALSDKATLGVVDGQFNVHGTRNLFVADASLFPTTIAVNLPWLVMGIGLLAGRTIRETIGVLESR